MISSIFFSLFSQLGVGMMLCLLFISPRVIGNSFFKFASLTAAILLAVVIGFDFLWPSPVRSGHLPVIFLAISAALTFFYNRIVGANKLTAALVLLIGACVTGLLSIVTDSIRFTRLLELGQWEHPLLAVNHLAATALLGAVMLTMVFGHWYLVIPGLSITHLARLTRVLMATIIIRIATIVLTFGVLQTKQEIPLSRVLSELFLAQGIFFWPRLLFGVVTPIVLTAMIWSTIKLKHTQAATGLLYLAVVALLFGEFFSKFLLFTVGVSL